MTNPPNTPAMMTVRDETLTFIAEWIDGYFHDYEGLHPGDDARALIMFILSAPLPLRLELVSRLLRLPLTRRRPQDGDPFGGLLPPSEDTAEIERLHAQLVGMLNPWRTRPLEEWTEEMGDVLWWKFPITEPPYVGSPLDKGRAVEMTIRDSVRDYTYTENIGGWPGYHTHFTPLPLPAPPSEDKPKSGDEVEAKRDEDITEEMITIRRRLDQLGR